jgi:hypothetical protein
MIPGHVLATNIAKPYKLVAGVNRFLNRSQESPIVRLVKLNTVQRVTATENAQRRLSKP